MLLFALIARSKRFNHEEKIFLCKFKGRTEFAKVGSNCFFSSYGSYVSEALLTNTYGNFCAVYMKCRRVSFKGVITRSTFR